MRILIANDGMSDVGGVQAYLEAVIGGLERRGHLVALAYCTDSGSDAARSASRNLDKFRLTDGGARQAIERWAPHVCFSHNMHDLSADRALAATAPLVKFMHGYFGTCIGGQKMHAFPTPVACDRVFGAACAALYLPRRCGQMSPIVWRDQWRWATSQRELFSTYSAVIVASEHMRHEYVRNGCDPARVHVNPLFPTNDVAPVAPAPPQLPHVAFLGRMTRLKGGDLLVRAVERASITLGASVGLTMIGDGPQRREWEALARERRVDATFTGWLHGDRRWEMLRAASVLAVPSRWPEPFGFVGLEAAALGVPAVAMNTGGIAQWLRPGINGVMVDAPATGHSFGDALAALLADRGGLMKLRAGAVAVAREMTLGAHIERLEGVFTALQPQLRQMTAPGLASAT
jgi:glycosyltransferase involved in cell wall biosynthesis